MLKLRKGPIFKILDKFEISGNTMTPDLDNYKTSVKHVVCNEKLFGPEYFVCFPIECLKNKYFYFKFW